MRIALAGIKQDDSEEFLNTFRKKWPNYKVNESLSKKELIDKKIILGPFSNDKNQYTVLNLIIDDVMLYRKTDNVLHDTSVLDNLINTFWLASKDHEGFDDLYIQKAIHLTKQALNFYDIIFYIPMTDSTNKSEYDLELSNFYSVVMESYTLGKPWIFPFDSPNGSPAVIEIFGTIQEKIEMIKLYLNVDGMAYNEKDSLIADAIQ